MNELIVQYWEESERGWGVRPDGYSLHVSDSDRKSFIDAYWKSMPSEAPAEYSRPRKGVGIVEVPVEIAAAVAATENGKRFYDRPVWLNNAKPAAQS